MNIYKNFQEQELKNDLICIYNEIQIALQMFNQLKKREIKQRLKLALYWLNKYVSRNDTITHL